MRKYNGKILSIDDCMKLSQQKIIKIVDDPCVTILEIYEYLPIIQAFEYRGTIISSGELEKIVESGVMNLKYTKWDRIQYANALLPFEYVEEIILYGLQLKDADTLEKYSRLKRLDLRIGGDFYFECIHNLLKAIHNFYLEWIYIFTEDGNICDYIVDLIKEKQLFVEKILVDTTEYSIAYVKIYQLMKQEKSIDLRYFFNITKRTSIMRAEEEYQIFVRTPLGDKYMEGKKRCDILNCNDFKIRYAIGDGL